LRHGSMARLFIKSETATAAHPDFYYYETVFAIKTPWKL